MPDVAQFDVNSSPLIIYGVKTDNQRKRQILLIESSTITNHLSLQSNIEVKVSAFRNNEKLSENFV